MTPKFTYIKSWSIDEDMVRKAEQVLIDNGIESDEADTVLQALGYVLLDKELYEDDEPVPSAYDMRKKELNDAMYTALRSMDHGFCFERGEKTFRPVYCGEFQEESLLEVFIDDFNEGKVITVITLPVDAQSMEDEVVSAFTEFSNAEMELIMEMCGVKYND